MTRKVSIPQLSLRADIAPGNKEKRTAKLTWSTGAKVLRANWLGDKWYEQLSMDPAHVRMDRLKSGNAPLLDTHAQWELRNVIGVIEKADLEGASGTAETRFSQRAEVEPIYQDVVDQILRNVSVGYRIYKMERQPDVEGEKIPTYLVTDWEPCEISLVPVGADPDAALSRSMDERGSECIVINNIAEERGEEASMSLKVKEGQSPAPVADPSEGSQVDVSKERSEATLAERKRVKEIRLAARAAGFDEKFVEEHVEKGTAAEAVRSLVIEKLAAQDEATQTRAQNPTITAGNQDEVQTRREGMEAALSHRASPQHFKAEDKGRPFMGMSLLRMAEEIVGMERSKGLSRSQLAERALSTSDFPLILANTASKTLRKAYETQPQSFRPFIVPGTLPDYKAMNRLQLGDAPDLLEVGEDGEVKSGSIGEGGETIKLIDYARKLLITSRTIINDDLQALGRIPRMFGSAAARLESKLVYGVLLDNSNMADGVALFHANHGNLPAASAISDPGLTAAEALLRKMKTLDGADYLDLSPSFLVCGPDKKVEAFKILSSQIVATKSGDANPWLNTMKPIVDARVTGNKWFIIADPAQIDTIELAYLEGMNGPEITSERDFDSEGLKIKCKHVVGVKAIDYRGMIYNSGL